MVKREEKEKKVSLGSALVICFITLVIGVFVGMNWNSFAATFMPYLGFKSSGNTNDWSSLDEVYNTLAAKYDGEVEFSAALEGAKKGIAASVGDVYTSYMTASEAADFNKSLHGEVGAGIGVAMAKRGDYIRITRVLPDNPAKKAGILAGDIIYKIDGKNVLGEDASELATKLRGEKGTKVSLTIVRDGEEKTFDLVREEINNVSAYVDYSGQTAIIHVTRFDTDTGTLVKNFTKEFADKNINKVVLDLRDNGGGYVSAAKDLLSLWIDSKAVLVQKSVRVPEETVYANHGQATLSDMKTIVLTNGGTASASEIVAGALKDYNKATIIGEKTYGKGVVQTLVNLSGGALLKVTTAHWYTPEGNTINTTGISPDQEIVRSYDDINNDRDPQMDAALSA
ncbi:S41 family peptidase [Candidatus Saccharibacteria bacterium]|nr:S41 family peptidase [Candidatus Saccharibacteria bacterium]